MKILSLNIQDLKRISAVEINPKTGKPIILTGDNGEGKSSVLDSIILALSNTGLDDPIRHGRPSGSVKLTLGADKLEYTLERQVTKKGDKLTLTDANGLPVQKPQTFLNGLLGNYAFDPLEFTRLKPKEQVEALKTAASLDFTEIDAARLIAYNERTSITREGKEAAAQLAACTVPEKDVPTEEVSAVSLVGNLRVLEDAGRVAEDAAKMETAQAAAVREAEKTVADLKKMLNAAELVVGTAKAAHAKAQFDLSQADGKKPTPEALQAAKEAIATADQTNLAVRNARKYRELDERVKGLRVKVGNLNRQIEEIDEQKAAAIKDANLPLDGLELTDDGVMMNGTFFSQLSTSEQIRVSTLVAMSQNPTLKIVIVKEGALMNSANLKILFDLAAERDFQVWLEKFSETPCAEGLHIVDGSIAFEDGQPTE